MSVLGLEAKREAHGAAGERDLVLSEGAQQAPELAVRHELDERGAVQLIADDAARAIRSVIRADDLLFRWGGDEFLILMSCREDDK